ncbi:MAG: hypothetical protein NT038_03580 [Euryarchaeota archaeon]|nr:hypothetical protein [Euryarchaeota archaeon]
MSSKYNPKFTDVPTAGDIAYWIDPNEMIMAHDVVNSYIKTEVLAPESDQSSTGTDNRTTFFSGH